MTIQLTEPLALPVNRAGVALIPAIAIDEMTFTTKLTKRRWVSEEMTLTMDVNADVTSSWSCASGSSSDLTGLPEPFLTAARDFLALP